VAPQKIRPNFSFRYWFRLFWFHFFPPSPS
jgi:hypothetical protein